MDSIAKNGNGNGNGNQSFADFITRERERLTGERDVLEGQMSTLQDQLTGVDREMAAIDAYESTKSGKAPAVERRGRPRGAVAVATRTRRGSKREALLQVIRQAAPTGLKRSEILDKMGLRGDKSGEMSVSNALTALIKSKSIDRRDGRYIPANT